MLQHHLLSLELININNPESIMLEQQKILAKINQEFSKSIKEHLHNYDRDIPEIDEYNIIIGKLSQAKSMQDFALAEEVHQVQLVPEIEQPQPETTANPHEPQNPYDNAGMYCALGVAVVGFIAIGVMLCATGNPALGGVFIAGAIISALILGIAKIYEEVSEKKEKKPEIDTLTALKEVLTPQWLSKDRVSNV